MWRATDRAKPYDKQFQACHQACARHQTDPSEHAPCQCFPSWGMTDAATNRPKCDNALHNTTGTDALKPSNIKHKHKNARSNTIQTRNKAYKRKQAANLDRLLRHSIV